MSITHRYDIKMAKLNSKHFRPSGSPIILVSSDPVPIPIPRGTPSVRGVKYKGGNWQFSCDFRRKLLFISETMQDRLMVAMEH